MQTDVVGVFEYEVDGQGNSSVKAWEVKNTTRSKCYQCGIPLYRYYIDFRANKVTKVL
ncbi:MAG TPA: hypothetical protein VE544_02130 [Nitrososphaeraceae archaeon]|nr:hypothetical protein [Nitrososphaeraceae archaeon]